MCIHLFTYLSIHLSIYLSIHSSIYLFHSGPDPIRTGTPDAPILVPGKGNSKGSSEAFAFEYGAPLKTRLGLRLTKVYKISGRGVCVCVCFVCVCVFVCASVCVSMCVWWLLYLLSDSPDDDEHCTSQRHPSIASLLKRKLQKSVRSRVDDEKGKDGDEGRESNGGFLKYSFASKVMTCPYVQHITVWIIFHFL